MKTLKDERHLTLLWMLLGADIVFIIIHLLHYYTSFAESELYTVTKDRGYPEIFQYVKEFWITVLLFTLLIRERQIVYGTWSLLFGYLLLDDSFQIHEKMGGKFADYVHHASFMKLAAQDFGELVASVVAGVIFFSLIGAAYCVASSETRRVCKQLALLLGAIIFFGVFVDAVHSTLASSSWDVPLGTVEDGGEMLAMSVTCWYVFNWVVGGVSDASAPA